MKKQYDPYNLSLEEIKESKPYRLSIEKIQELLEQPLDKCEINLYKVGLLIDEHGTDLKWMSVPSYEEYENKAPDMEYIKEVKRIIRKYQEKYSKETIYDKKGHKHSAVSVRLGAFIDDLKRCEVEIKKGIYDTSIYPNRYNLRDEWDEYQQSWKKPKNKPKEKNSAREAFRQQYKEKQIQKGIATINRKKEKSIRVEEKKMKL